MRTSTLPRSIAAALLSGLAACSSPPPPASTPWDQARVTRIAERLDHAAIAWERAILGQPGAGPRLQQNAHELRTQTSMLADHLLHGSGRDETYNYYRTLREVVDDTEEFASRTPLIEPTLGAWTLVADEMRQLAPYY